MENPQYKVTEATKFFDKLNILWYLASLPDFWINAVNLPKKFQRFYDPYMKGLHYVMIGFVVFSLGGFFTQHNLTPPQQHRMVIGLASCTTLVYRLVLCHYRSEVKDIIYYLTVPLKEYNNLEVEQKMLFKVKRYTYVFFCTSLSSVILRGFKAALQVYRGGKHYKQSAKEQGKLFVTFVTIWPDVADASVPAEFTRYIIYFMWYIILLQSLGAVLMVMTIMILISQQYENLARYFYDLDDIFKDDGKKQVEKEMEYESGLVKGLQWHVITLWCVDRCQHVCKIIYNIHLTLGPVILVFILPEMLNPDLNTKEKLGQLPVMISILIFLGFFMWTAGDITVEASKLPEALFGSGWQNCHGRTGVRVRKMIIFAMQQAQQPVLLSVFGTFEMSYESYVSIVKSSYSLFSVLAM
ncbi:uncharacterized protein LOC142973814 [Anticarsia gemmatalis]|uniref:uncharacterized protein LOC142973814 n=1 Tax=Anticarsia gemmatalis TaxID=129554 RepID=UPI003F76D814